MSSTNKLNKLQLYKSLLRSASKFPSVNRQQIYETIRHEWRLYRHETNDKKINDYINQAKRGLDYLKAFDVTLTGSDVKIELSGKAQVAPNISLQSDSLHSGINWRRRRNNKKQKF